jgi:hypothetical protein
MKGQRMVAVHAIRNKGREIPDRDRKTPLRGNEIGCHDPHRTAAWKTKEKHGRRRR